MFCPNCGKKISKDSKFCEYCGGKFTSSGENEKVIPIPQNINDNDNKLSDQEIYQIALLISEAKHAANRIIIGGAGWIIGGIVLTMATGGFVIFWGMPLYGICRLIKGLYYRMMPQKLINDTFGGKDDKEEGCPQRRK